MVMEIRAADPKEISKEEIDKISKDLNDSLEMHKLKCPHCKRDILVDITQFGISHIATISCVCAECLIKHGINPSFKKHYKKKAEELETWLKKLKTKKRNT
jgi:hypothetical protein